MFSRKDLLIVLIIFLTANLGLIGLILTPELAFGQFQPDSFESVTIGEAAPYDLKWYNDDMYFLTLDDENHHVLGRYSDGSVEILNENLQQPQFPNKGRIGAVYDDLIYINELPTSRVVGNSQDIYSSIGVYSLDGERVDEIQYNEPFEREISSNSYVETENIAIRDNNLVFEQALTTNLNSIIKFHRVVEVDLEDTSDGEIYFGEVGTRELDFITRGGSNYIVTQEQISFFVREIEDDGSVIEIGRYNMTDFGLQFDSYDLFYVMDENRLLFIDIERTLNGTGIEIVNFNSENHFKYTLDYYISPSSPVHIGNYLLLGGSLEREIGTMVVTKPLLLGFQFQEEELELQELHAELLEEDVLGVFFRPAVEENKLGISLQTIVSSGNQEGQLLYSARSYSFGVLRDDISPILQVNSVALVGTLLYVGTRLFLLNRTSVKSDQELRASDELEYPKHEK